MILDGISKGSLQDKAFGCIMGAFIGDTCGVFLNNDEKKSIAKEETMDMCM